MMHAVQAGRSEATDVGFTKEVRIERLPAEQSAAHAWDRTLKDSRGSFCHLAGWRGIMEDVLGHETHYLTAVDDSDSINGVLPLVRVRSRLFGSYLLSMPFLNYGGPLGHSGARRKLVMAATDLAKKHNVDLLELRSRTEAPEGTSSVARKVISVLPLPATSQELWDRHFRAKLRSQIRKPIKEGLEPRFGSAELDAFYDVFARNMRDLGTPVLPRRWFEAISKTFAESSLFCAVYYKGAPVAGACGFFFNGEFEITWASSLREQSARAPNMLLYWSLMEECIRRGATAFNFGRSTPGASTHRFKQQWGGVDSLLTWGVWGKKLSPPNPDSAKFTIARNMWSKLPVAVSKVVGPVLARQLP
jgi:serine/alanine adding enzyme